MPVGRSLRNPRLLLLAGFGGLLLLMALAALDDLRQIRSIETRSNSVRTAFIERNRLLNEIRSDIYLSGTWVRDYVLEPDRSKTRSYRTSLERTRASLTSQINQYRAVLRNDERPAFETLESELRAYWNLIGTVLDESNAPQAEGYTFLRDRLYPLRTELIGLADQISTMNEHDLNTRILQVTELFAGFRVRVAFTMLAALFLGALLALFTGRRILAYERDAADHLVYIEQARQELRELSTRLVAAQETERRSISRELHDEVGQSLSALLVTLSNMAAEMPAAGASASAHLAASRELAESALRCVRNMALLLRPSMLDDLGLLPALQWQAREISKRSGIAVRVDAEGVPENLPEEYRTAIYRVVQEALHNAEQHSHAHNARVTMRAHGNALALSVQDDGSGFDGEHVRGMGLLGMQERISNLQGTCNIEAGEGKGTLVTVRLPLPA